MGSFSNIQLSSTPCTKGLDKITGVLYSVSMNRSNRNKRTNRRKGNMKNAALVPLSGPSALDTPAVSRLVDAFLAGRNERTMKAYQNDLEDFAAFVKVSTADEAARLLLAHGQGQANELVLRYKAELVDRGLAAATINRRLAALRAMVKLGRTLGIVPWALEVSNLRAEPYRDTKGPGRAGFRRLLDELDERMDDKGRRDRAILRLLFDLALRRGEVVSLDVVDLDLEAGTVAVLGKGRTGKIKLTLPGPTRDALRSWLDVWGNKAGPLFVNFDRAGKGRRLTATSVYRLVRDLGLKAGLKVRPHGLRHAAITEALDLTGGDVRKVARFSRHKDLRTLNVYDDARADLGGEVAALVAGAV